MPRTSLAGLFIATTAIGAVIACWVNFPDGEGNIVATGAAAAFVAAILMPYGLKGGLIIGVICVVICCALVPKDPSGLGPFELIFPIQLVVGAIPILAAAWAGKSLRDKLGGG